MTREEAIEAVGEAVVERAERNTEVNGISTSSFEAGIVVVHYDDEETWYEVL